MASPVEVNAVAEALGHHERRLGIFPKRPVEVPVATGNSRNGTLTSLALKTSPLS